MKTLTRRAAIAALRSRLSELADDEHSVCEVAARKGIYCHGFSQWSFEELKDRYWWLVDQRPGISRAELERLANIWQLGRQALFGTKSACDTQSLEHDTCKGWDEWDDEALARFVQELLGEPVAVVPNPPT